MSKPANDSTDHWKRLAAELGLDLGPEPEPIVEAELQAPVSRTRRRAPEVEEPVLPVLVAEETPAPAEELAAIVEDERIELVETTPVESEFEPNPESQPEDEKPRRRGRRRSRRKKGDERPDEAAVTKTATADATDDDGDSPADAVRDWNIPSWNDLIASLYRPER
jgi:hypothetical protein